MTHADTRPLPITITREQLAAALVLAGAVTTAAGLAVPIEHAPALRVTSSRDLVVTPARPRAFPSSPPITGRLAAVLAVGAVADVAVLGSAGVLFAHTALGQLLAAGLLTVAGVLGLLFLIGIGSGVVHCPGCPA